MRNKLLLRLCRRVRYYRVIATPTRWQDCRICQGSYPFFWLAELAVYRYLMKHPFATVWIVPRGPITDRFREKHKQLNRDIAEWTIDFYDPFKQ